MKWMQLFTSKGSADKIFLVRLESGENIAQYTSQTAQPVAGDVINVRHNGHIQPFEIVEATLQPIIDNFELGVLVVKPATMRAILHATLHSQQIRDVLLGLLLGFILIISPLLRVRRPNNREP
jgi:hypothetical protein